MYILNIMTGLEKYIKNNKMNFSSFGKKQVFPEIKFENIANFPSFLEKRL